MKQKTRKELEKDKQVLGIWAIILTILLFILTMMAVYSYWDKFDLKTQLSECQERVPIYIFNEKKVGNTISFWSNYTGEFVNYIEVGVISYYRNGIEVWDMPKEEIQLRKEVWCKVNEIENCEVIE